MINKVKETIEKYNLIDENDKIVVGVSGGPDSICLLNILYTLGANVIVCHVNHGLRENGNLDEKFVKEFCDSRNIKFFVKRINLKDKDSLNGMSTEEAGRKARYDFFDAILICSDGFWEYILESEMCSALQNVTKADQWLTIMKDILSYRVSDKNDNNTAIMIMKRGV